MARTAKRIIVVCPCSLVENWDNEFIKRLGPGVVKTLVLAGQGRNAIEKNIDCFVTTNMFNVLIASYETIRKHVGRLTKYKDCCDLLVCDQAHRLKNRENQLYKALFSIPCKRRVLLTGTPMPNDLKEFFAMVDFANPGVLGTQGEFRRQTMAPILCGRKPDATDQQKQRMIDTQQEMSATVNDFILRRVNTLNAQAVSKPLGDNNSEKPKQKLKAGGDDEIDGDASNTKTVQTRTNKSSNPASTQDEPSNNESTLFEWIGDGEHDESNNVNNNNAKTAATQGILVKMNSSNDGPSEKGDNKNNEETDGERGPSKPSNNDVSHADGDTILRTSTESKRGDSGTDKRATAGSDNASSSMPITSKKRRNKSDEKIVFDVIEASSTDSAKQRRMDRPKTAERFSATPPRVLKIHPNGAFTSQSNTEDSTDTVDAMQRKDQFSTNENRQFEQGCNLHGWGNWEQVQTYVPFRMLEEVKDYAAFIAVQYPGMKERLIEEHKDIWVKSQKGEPSVSTVPASSQQVKVPAKPPHPVEGEERPMNVRKSGSTKESWKTRDVASDTSKSTSSEAAEKAAKGATPQNNEINIESMSQSNEGSEDTADATEAKAEPSTTERSSATPQGGNTRLPVKVPLFNGALTSQSTNEESTNMADATEVTVEPATAEPREKELKKLEQLECSSTDEKEEPINEPLPAERTKLAPSEPLFDTSGHLIKFNSNDIILSLHISAYKSVMHKQFKKLGPHRTAEGDKKASDEVFQMFKKGGGRFFKLIRDSTCEELGGQTAWEKIRTDISRRMESSSQWLDKESNDSAAKSQSAAIPRKRKRKEEPVPTVNHGNVLAKTSKIKPSSEAIPNNGRSDETMTADQSTVTFHCPKCSRDVVFASATTVGASFANHVNHCDPEKKRKESSKHIDLANSSDSPDNGTQVTIDEPIDPDELMSGSRVIVNEEGESWEATIRRRHKEKGEPGFMIHYDWKKSTIENWVPIASVVNFIATSSKKSTRPQNCMDAQGQDLLAQEDLRIQSAEVKRKKKRNSDQSDLSDRPFSTNENLQFEQEANDNAGITNNYAYQTNDNITNDMDPSSIDWIEQMASTVKQMEQMAATTKHKFNQQRQYYETQLQAQRERNHEQGRENERLRMEKDAQNSSMKEEIEALKLELNKKGASLENLKESMRSLL